MFKMPMAGSHSRRASNGTATLRIALISSPRSGNTWLRHLVASILGLDQLPIYNPMEADWDHVPRRCVLMTHWPRTEPFLSLLKAHGFKVVTLARQPLDVLVSILHFTAHNPETARWLGGLGGDERSIAGGSPCDPKFLRYAAGQRAQALLSVSREWCDDPGSHRLRYEDLVRDTPAALAGILTMAGESPTTSIAEATAAHTIAERRSREGLHHWRGIPGQWRMLLTAGRTRRVAAVHAESLRAFGYRCNPDEGLTSVRAEANWSRIARSPIPQLADRGGDLVESFASPCQCRGFDALVTPR